MQKEGASAPEAGSLAPTEPAPPLPSTSGRLATLPCSFPSAAGRLACLPRPFPSPAGRCYRPIPTSSFLSPAACTADYRRLLCPRALPARARVGNEERSRGERVFLASSPGNGSRERVFRGFDRGAVLRVGIWYGST